VESERELWKKSFISKSVTGRIDTILPALPRNFPSLKFYHLEKEAHRANVATRL